MTTIKLQDNKKIYFASDFHLGYPDHQTSLIRERKLVKWLNSIQNDAQTIFLVGDIFDFWFEYKNVVPKGFVRLLGKLAEMSDAGIEIVIFSGNHDIWMFDYFTKEMNIKVFRDFQDYIIEQNGKSTSFYVVHGDGLGPGDYGYKFLKKVFESKLSIWAFGWIHPQVGITLATWWSGSRKDEERIKRELQFRGDNEWLWSYAKEQEAQKHRDFYIFGHRHLLLDLPVSDNSRYINLGQWAYDDENSNHFAVFDGENLVVRKFE
ncbi:UDP-2,3-diacylglucosamine diphosphatase [Arcicella sp. LKC2W]|uniref:UDP-2,3-diacylglucosamine diphosphatase n=1 Tax=Arcicella sp. LKC2W TaxID=2984198 RepID=UPI002B215E84|nr:UDP-2,3-diacylglucosamine diphosphatase [Arcicella sp. LKC2W]MEA5460681.1 UDP-2,3-diacylglucosamine diphosphatase [Arcicella sp. LKC2W]